MLKRFWLNYRLHIARLNAAREEEAALAARINARRYYLEIATLEKELS